MAKSREQLLQETLGAMVFQIACLSADLLAAQEELDALKAAPSETEPRPRPMPVAKEA